ncbi:MAG: hypothetical protein ACE5WD_01405 [Candidatus Aminicenantia bacterium]
MKNKESQEDFREIKSLILKEEEEALRIFRESDFKSRLAARIKSESWKEFSFPLLLKKHIPVLRICLLLIFVGALIIISILLHSHNKGNFKFVEKFLQQTPGLQRIVKSKVDEGITLATVNNEYSELEWAIKRVLFSVYKEELPRKNLSALIAQIFFDFPKEKEIAFPMTGEDPTRLNLNKKIEGLKKGNKVYRFLLKISTIK